MYRVLECVPKFGTFLEDKMVEKMDSQLENLANKLNEFLKSDAPFRYKEVFEDGNSTVADLIRNMTSLNIEPIENYLKDIVESNQEKLWLLKNRVNDARRLLTLDFGAEKLELVDAYVQNEVTPYAVSKEIGNNGLNLAFVYKNAKEELTSNPWYQAENLLREWVLLKRELLLEKYKNEEVEMLCSNQDYIGVYQLKDTTENDMFQFMNSDFFQKNNRSIFIDDYQLVYMQPINSNVSLGALYEQFNLDIPSDYAGHSLSVSDIVLRKQNDTVQTHFVDSIGFCEVVDFLQQYAVSIPEGYVCIQKCDEGYDYSIYTKEYELKDGGVYDNPDISIIEALKDILSDETTATYSEMSAKDYNTIVEKATEVEQKKMQEHIIATNKKVTEQSPKL